MTALNKWLQPPTPDIRPWALMAIWGALIAFTSLSTDTYLPALPQMAKDLQGNAELTVTAFLGGFAIAQLVWGPISDRIGRRIPLFMGMLLFVVGSIGCALSQTMEQIMFWRVFQAVGACTGPMLARAMVRDRYQRTEAAQMLSTLTMILAIAPIVGPLLGGQIILFSSWHMIFIMLAVIGVVMFVSVKFLPETLPANQRSDTSLAQAFMQYKPLLKNWAYLRYVLCVTAYYVAAFAFITGSPFVYIEYFGVSEQHYGWLFAINILGVMGLSFLNRTLVTRFKLDTLLKVSSMAALLAAAVLLLLVHFEIGGIYGVMLPVFVVFSSNGVIAASATAAALDEVQAHEVGSASALLGSLQYGSGVVSTVLLALFSDGTPWTMAWIIGLFCAICMILAFIEAKQSQC